MATKKEKLEVKPEVKPEVKKEEKKEEKQSLKDIYGDEIPLHVLNKLAGY